MSNHPTQICESGAEERLELLQVNISIQGEKENERKDGVSSFHNTETNQPTSTSGTYQCKPDLSCWSYLPPSIVERGSKIKNWFWSDMIKTHLFWIKLIFFFQSGSLVVLYPYLVIHMRSLGLSVEEVALVNGVIPLADIIGPPLAGFVADKIGNFRVFMSLMTVVSGASSLLLLLIPPKLSGSAEISGHFQVTCCADQPCHDINNATFLTTFLSNNDSIATCNFHEDGTFALYNDNGFQDTVIATNETKMTKGCENFQCDYKDNWIYNNGFQERTNWSQILIFYTLLRCLIDVLRASSVMMFEGAVVVTIKQMGGDYGLQKLFGTFGAIIWGPISGQILDMASSSSGKENYEPIFYLFFVMRFISALLILKLNLSFKKPAKKVFKNLWKLIIRPHIFMFLVIFFVCGCIWGFIEAYLFWFLEDLGSTKLTMGISLAVGTVAGIPLTIASGAIIKRFGNCNVIVFALALYSLRLLGYSFIESALQSLFFEVLKPFGNSLLVIAAMTYAKNNASIETMASLEGVMGALYFGIGKATGSLVGGLVIDDLGVRNTFRCFSILSLTAASIYFCFNYVHEKKLNQDQNVDTEAGISVIEENKKHPSEKKFDISDAKIEESNKNDSRST